MNTHENSVFGWVKALSRHYAKKAAAPSTSAFRNKNNSNTASTIARKLQRITYSILLYRQHVKNYETGESLLDCGLSELECLHTAVYNLRLCRKLDSANQLDYNVRHLQEIVHDSLDDNLKAILRFLLLVASFNESEQNSPKAGEMSIFKTPPCHSVIINEPLNYGERNWNPKQDVHSNNFFYTHFPSEIFDMKSENLLFTKDSPFSIDDPKIFEKITSGRNWFVQSCLQNDTKLCNRNASESASSLSLHGALVRSADDDQWSVDNRLEIPEIAKKSPAYLVPSRTCSRVSSKSQSSEDEGFIEADTPLSAGTIQKESAQSVWEIAFSADLKKHYTWEQIGQHEVLNQKPYLSECGPDALDELVASLYHNLCLLDPSIAIPYFHKVTTKQLLRDVRYVLLGIVSTSFGYSTELDQFYPTEGLIVHGLSPEALASLLREVASDGTLYWRLCRFSTPGKLNSVYGKGFVFQAFSRGVKCFLHYYHATMIASTSRNSLLNVLAFTRKFRLQLRYVADLCNCTSSSHDDNDFPLGIALLSQLVSHTLAAVDSEYYLITLSLLKTACIPYLKFLQRWIYEGVCDDQYGEFLIVPNVDHLFCRDHSFWEQGFCLLQPPNLSFSFLQDLMEFIFVCGKSLNLLKLCCSQHHLFVARNDIPELSLTFSEKELKQIEKCTLERKQQMEMVAASQKKCRQEMMEQAELERVHKIESKKPQVRKRNELQKHMILVEIEEKIETVKPKQQSGKEQRNLNENITDESRGLRPHQGDRRFMRSLSLRGANNTEMSEVTERKRLDVNDDKTLVSPDAGFFEMKMHMTPDTTPSSETPGTTSLLSEDLMSLSVTTADDAFTPSDATDIQLEITEMLNNATNLILASDLQQDHVNSDNNANTIDNALGNGNESTASSNRVQFLLPDESQATGAKRKRSYDEPDHGKDSDSSRTRLTSAKEEKPSHVSNGKLDDAKESRCEESEKTKSNNKQDNNTDFVQLMLLDAGVALKTRGRSEHGHSSDSTVQNMLYLHESSGDANGRTLLPKTSSSEPTLPVNTEMGLIEHHSLGLLKLRGRSVHGHASDSTIQKMMYGEKDLKTEIEPKEVEIPARKADQLFAQLLPDVVPYTTKFNFYELGATDVPPFSTFSTDHVNAVTTDFVGASLPLSVVIEQSLLLPIKTQIKLVNQSVVDYFLVDMNLLRNLEVIRDYILLNDGEFAQVMADELFQQVAQGVKPHKLLNPKNLTKILTKALDASLCNEDSFTKNLSFALGSIPSCFLSNVPAPFPGLELQYRTEWPLNIIITPECLSMYNQIFHFILKIRHLHWALTDVFYHLKKSARVKKAIFSPQFSQMQLFRHEMHHFVKVIQTYVCNQVLQVSWSELLHDIEHNVHNLDDLIDVHGKYLKRSLTRCLLNPKAAPVRALMQKVFSIALQFHSHMTSTSWQVNPKTGTLEHPAFWQLTSAHKRFQESTAFFYSVWLRDAVCRPSYREMREPRIPALLARLIDENEL